MKRVLVTGASGFLGRASTAALRARGFAVHGTGRGGPPPGFTGGDWHVADLLDPAARARLLAEARPSHLVHLAWEARPGLYRDSPENPAWAAASLDLLDRALILGVERILGIGTCFEYGPYAGPCLEGTTACRPVTPYGQAKFAASAGFAAAAQAGASVAWGRVFFPFGPGEAPSRLLPSLIRCLSAGEVFPCSHGAQLRDFLYIDDLAEAVGAVLDSRVTGCINLGSGEPRSLMSLIGFLASRLGGADRILYGARDVVGPDAEPMIVADNTRLRNETGWRERVGWEAGAERSLAWWRARLPAAAR